MDNGQLHWENIYWDQANSFRLNVNHTYFLDLFKHLFQIKGSILLKTTHLDTAVKDTLLDAESR